MRRRPAASMLLAALLLTGVMALTAHSQEALVVKREVRVGSNGLVLVTDEIPAAGTSELTVLLHDRDKLLDYVVEGGTVTATRVEGESLALTVRPSGNRVSVRSAYRGLIGEGADGTYVLSFRGAPALAGIEHATNVTFVLPAGAENVRVPAEHFIRNGSVVRYYPRSLDSVERSTIRFLSDSLVLSTIERAQLTVDPTSNVASLLVRVRNDGTSSFDFVRLRIPFPKEVNVLRAGDGLGPLRFGYDRSTGDLTVYFVPERYALSSGWRYEFTVTLQAEPGVLVRLGADTLSVATFLPVEAPTESFTVRVYLPEGFELASPDPSVKQYFTDDRGRYVIDLSTKAPYFSTGTVDLRVRGQPQQPLQLYVLLIGALVLFAGVVTSVIRRTTGPKLKFSESERASIERVRSRVGEVFSELNKVEELVREPSRAGLQPLQESVRRVRRLSDLLSQDLRLVSQKSSELSRAVSVAQRSLQDINESLRAIVNAYNSYHRGEIAKSAMEKMTSPILRDIRRSASSLREFELTLSELLG
ncbi:MAG: hypothetical protein RMJ75_01165 [Nitrososphaerota archaeon]|nr:hypothetical protein [Nitrososphaerota archaeon]